MRGWHGWSFAVLLAVLPMGCSQDVDAGEDVGSEGDGAEWYTVEVTFEGTSHEVSLGSVVLADFEGTPMARVSDLIIEALPSEDHASLAAFFVAADGFRPEVQENCFGMLPVAWENLSRGYIDPTGHRLYWDSALGWPGCLSPRDLAVIEVVRP
jgi:hypothetical protein